ncbi:hypothetical protein Leryth_016223, partial [Lithospermum erythrorhizon]
MHTCMTFSYSIPQRMDNPIISLTLGLQMPNSQFCKGSENSQGSLQALLSTYQKFAQEGTEAAYRAPSSSFHQAPAGAYKVPSFSIFIQNFFTSFEIFRATFLSLCSSSY